MQGIRIHLLSMPPKWFIIKKRFQLQNDIVHLI